MIPRLNPKALTEKLIRDQKRLEREAAEKRRERLQSKRVVMDDGGPVLLRDGDAYRPEGA